MRRGVQGKRMWLRLIALTCVIFGAISAEEARSQVQTFKAWKVEIRVDDFEGEVKPTLTADVFSVDGQKIGMRVLTAGRVRCLSHCYSRDAQMNNPAEPDGEVSHGSGTCLWGVGKAPVCINRLRRGIPSLHRGMWAGRNTERAYGRLRQPSHTANGHPAG